MPHFSKQSLAIIVWEGQGKCASARGNRGNSGKLRENAGNFRKAPRRKATGKLRESFRKASGKLGESSRKASGISGKFRQNPRKSGKQIRENPGKLRERLSERLQEGLRENPAKLWHSSGKIRESAGKSDLLCSALICFDLL